MHCKLVGEDALQVPMDPPEFILSPLSMTDAEYTLWSPGVAYVNQLKEELDYVEFNRTRLMPTLTIKVLSFFPSFPFLLSSFAFLYMVIFNCNAYTRMPLLLVSLLTLLMCLGRSMLMALMAILGSILCPATQTS